MVFKGKIGCCCCCPKESIPFIKAYSLKSIILAVIKLLVYMASIYFVHCRAIRGILVFAFLINICVLTFAITLRCKAKNPSYKMVKKLGIVMLIIFCIEILVTLALLASSGFMIHKMRWKHHHPRFLWNDKEDWKKNDDYKNDWNHTDKDYDKPLIADKPEVMDKPEYEEKSEVMDKPEYEKPDYYNKPKYGEKPDYEFHGKDKEYGKRRWRHRHFGHFCNALMPYYFSMIFFGLLIWQIYSSAVLIKCANYNLKQNPEFSSESSDETSDEEDARVERRPKKKRCCEEYENNQKIKFVQKRSKKSKKKNKKENDYVVFDDSMETPKNPNAKDVPIQYRERESED